MNWNQIFLRRKNKVMYFPAYSSDITDRIRHSELATLLKNVEGLGYTLSVDLIDELLNVRKEDAFEFYTHLMRDLKALLEKPNYKPMYVNFPAEVMDMSSASLYINALMHYISGDIEQLPENERSTLSDKIELKVINRGTESEFYEIISNLMGAKTSISDQDRAEIRHVLDSKGTDALKLIPNEMPFKENLVFVASYLIEKELATPSDLKHHFRTATDVLRLITALSGGDVSLAENTKYRSFKRKERRFFLSLLNHTSSNLEEDMVRHAKRWIRIGEILHPSEYKSRYLRTYIAFNKLRDNEKIPTFNSEVERLYKELTV